MKRVEEKVKDIVEVRPFSSLQDFTADPALTLLGYHFTDITSDLMAKWLDTVANVSAGRGSAAALAGFRGVGKSHFLAVLAAIVSRPDLRGTIIDQHVAARADRLSRRPHSVAFIKRGSRDTLLDELKAGLAPIIDAQPSELPDSFDELLQRASEKAGEAPLVLVIDTVLGRDSRVSRDDGAILSKIAETAKALGVFIALALDDDIAGADGANSSIAGNFSIDYLDQEHLYKVVDTHVFAKKDHARPILQEIYRYFSSVLPGFRWSEQRFMSLYPMHPATLEIAPLIRLFLHDFAMLGFASEAGVRILGRPANSLIGLDEIFDAVEKKMRNLPDLAEAFAAFDEIDRDVVAKTPVQLRLPAKLILKGLFMLSLDGEGSTATDIAASMLIVNEGETGAPAVDVGQLLDSISTAKPDLITRLTRDSSAAKFCFKVATKDDLNTVLDEAAKNIPGDAISSVLLRHACERFSDMGNFDDCKPASSSCVVDWRNAARHGEVFWQVGENAEATSAPNELVDWNLQVRFASEAAKSTDPASSGHPVFQWWLGNLTTEEADAIRRLYVLQTDSGLRETLGERFASANHILAIAVEKIWKRVFLTDAALVFGEQKLSFTDDAQAAHTLSHLLTVMLDPLFESEYPSHPDFFLHLGVKETAKLTGQFLGGSAAKNSDVQAMAEAFALPLGLVELQDGHYVPASGDAICEISFVRSMLDGLNFADDAVVTIGELSSRLMASPYGLTREARHLILASLVAQRQFEFVTFSGNRINHRSLDLQIIWDDIAGIAKPITEIYTSNRLREWAKLITGNAAIKSLDSPDDRKVIIEAMSGWLDEWKTVRVLDEFETLSDENLSASIWRIAANLKKTFGAEAAYIEALTRQEIALADCIHNIAELFSDSEAEFEKKKKDLDVLRAFIHGAAWRDEVAIYLSLCETTADADVENLRRTLLDLTGTRYFEEPPSTEGMIDHLWQEFKAKYSAYYIEKHDAQMNGPDGKALDEFLHSVRWAAFETFVDLPLFDRNFASGALDIVRRSRLSECRANVAELLEANPFCTCHFSLERFERRRDQATRLEFIVNSGLSLLHKRLAENGVKLIEAVDLAAGNASKNDAASLKKWLSTPQEADGLTTLSAQEIALLRPAIESLMTGGKTLNSRRLEDFGDLLPNEVRNWEKEIDRLETFAEMDA